MTDECSGRGQQYGGNGTGKAAPSQGALQALLSNPSNLRPPAPNQLGRRRRRRPSARRRSQAEAYGCTLNPLGFWCLLGVDVSSRKQWTGRVKSRDRSGKSSIFSSYYITDTRNTSTEQGSCRQVHPLEIGDPSGASPRLPSSSSATPQGVNREVHERAIDTTPCNSQVFMPKQRSSMSMRTRPLNRAVNKSDTTSPALIHLRAECRCADGSHK